MPEERDTGPGRSLRIRVCVEPRVGTHRLSRHRASKSALGLRVALRGAVPIRAGKRSRQAAMGL